VSNLKGEKTRPRVEVQLRLDFLNEPREDRPSTPSTQSARPRNPETEIQVPREISTWEAKPEAPVERAVIPYATASFPVSYISQAQHRIEMYRKLAQAQDPAALSDLKKELRDRFGALPPAAELLLKAAELKLLAAERNVTVIETKGDKLMLTRNHDFLMASGKFPRLTKTTAPARMNEIKRLLLSL